MEESYTNEAIRAEIITRLKRLREERRDHAIKAQKVDYGYGAAIGELELLLKSIDDNEEIDMVQRTKILAED